MVFVRALMVLFQTTWPLFFLRADNAVFIAGEKVMAMYPGDLRDRVLVNRDAEAGRAGPVVGNGSLLFRIMPERGSACSTDFCTLNGVGTFKFSGVRDSSTSQSSSVAASSATEHECEWSIGLANGVYSCTFAENVDSDSRLECDLLALRHSPHCALQKIRVVGSDRLLDHCVQLPSGALATRADLSIRHVNGRRVPCLGIHAIVGGVDMAYCCAYSSTSAEFDGVKHRSVGDPKVECVVRAPGGSEVSIMHSIIHGPKATIDNAFSAIAAQYRTNEADVHARARRLHTLRWTHAWDVAMRVDNASLASAADVEKIRVLNLHLASSVYRLLSSTKSTHDPAYRLDSYDATISTATPTISYARSCVLALLTLAPWASWGAPTPPLDEWVPLHVFAQVITDTLAMYRATLDRSALESRWTTSIRHVADYLVTRVDAAEVDGVVETLSGNFVERDAYTTGILRRALDAAVQITHAIRSTPDPTWSQIRGNLVVPRTDDFTLSIKETPVGVADGLCLLDPAMLPSYASVTDLGPHVAVVDDNLEAVHAASQSNPSTNPAVFSSISTLCASVPTTSTAQDAQATMDVCFERLMSAAELVVDPLWGCASAKETTVASDIVSTVAFGFLGLRIQGHITRDGIHVVPNAIVDGPSTAVLPSSWGVVRRRASGSIGARAEHITQNSLEPAFQTP